MKCIPTDFLSKSVLYSSDWTLIVHIRSLAIIFFFWCSFLLLLVFSSSFLILVGLLLGSFLLSRFLLFYLLLLFLHLLVLHLHLLLLHHLLFFLGVLKIWITSHVTSRITPEFSTLTSESLSSNLWHFGNLFLVFLMMNPISIKGFFL